MITVLAVFLHRVLIIDPLHLWSQNMQVTWGPWKHWLHLLDYTNIQMLWAVIKKHLN